MINLDPLVSFLRGDTTVTNDKNINLLAWVIDFKLVEKNKRSWKWILLNPKIRKATLLIITIVIIFYGGYLLSIKHTNQCMYWTGNQYQPIPCNTRINNTEIVALDTFKVAHLKRITRPDTLTINSVNKVWRAKINGKPEFYTSGGRHPLDNNKMLWPMTEYFLDKHVLKK
ncbi:hypothetical protein [Pedobacter metabolipauper]|uniref:hypothetical protein n=1 Tax=Pedobacter metabolipauper TaxID=425513 RepID=UPI00106099EC|nr:hypothetical protein [Pedobacter metabolipauper]